MVSVVIFALNEIGTPEYIQKMLNDNKHHILNFVGLKGWSEKSPCKSGEMKAEPLRYYDKYIIV